MVALRNSQFGITGGCWNEFPLSPPLLSFLSRFLFEVWPPPPPPLPLPLPLPPLAAPPWSNRIFLLLESLDRRKERRISQLTHL